jgi:hypothetical protein
MDESGWQRLPTIRISAMASAWAKANLLALEKSEGWKIDCTKGTVSDAWLMMGSVSRFF